MTKTIYFLRHGETDYNKKRIVQGSGVDSSLNETGRLQAEAFYKKYGSLPFEIVLTSSLQRTHQTVRPFVEAGLPWEQFKDIDEMHWGVHEGKGNDPVMRDQYRAMIEAWEKGDFDASVEGGESANQLATRIQRFIDHLRKRPEKMLLVCSHGRAMRCLMCLMDGKPLYEMESYQHKNTGLYKVIYENDRFRIELSNDISHLLDL